MAVPTEFLPKGLRRVVEMLLAAIALGCTGVAIQAWVDSRAHAAVEMHSVVESVRLDEIQRDVTEIKSDVKEIRKAVK